ncbi:MAG: hypothetical protein RLZZ387_351 [Chloroflexota bacterium]|jgi:hypothetical protein
MGNIFTIHNLFGERVLPILIVLVAVWLTVVWRPGQEVPRAARLFPILVDIQATLGLIYWIFGIVNGADYLSFPFILHPLLGLISAGVAHMAVKPSGPFSALGRWAPLTALAVLLATVIGGIVLARAV